MASGDITGVTGVPELTWCYNHNTLTGKASVGTEGDPATAIEEVPGASIVMTNDHSSFAQAFDWLMGYSIPKRHQPLPESRSPIHVMVWTPINYNPS